MQLERGRHYFRLTLVDVDMFKRLWVVIHNLEGAGSRWCLIMYNKGFMMVILGINHEIRRI
ncbi:hypothetical protein LguiA_017565 [Lonicera macranthoides]